MTEPITIAGAALQHWATVAGDDALLAELNAADIRALFVFALGEHGRANRLQIKVDGLEADVVALRTAASIARAELLACARRDKAAMSVEAMGRHFRNSESATKAAERCAIAIYSTKRDLPEDGGPEPDEEAQSPEEIVRTIDAAFASGLLDKSMRP